MLDLRQYDNAINLPGATGDGRSPASSRCSQRRSLRSRTATTRLGRWRRTRPTAVLTAFVVSFGGPRQAAPEAGRVRDWLDAIEAADAKPSTPSDWRGRRISTANTIWPAAGRRGRGSEPADHAVGA